MGTTTRTPQQLVRVLDADPDLGEGLSPERLARARAELVARLLVPTSAGWRDQVLDVAGADGMGLLVLDGILARELAMSDNVTTELLGPGDVIKSAGGRDPARLLRAEVRWTMLEPARLAVLGPQFAAAVAGYPEVCAAIMDRLIARAHRLAVAQAISQLNGVERRIEALLWQLAERWGRVGSEGVIIPLVLPHRIVAQVVGARRPTVSTAIGVLTAQGRLARLPDGTWLLPGEPVGLPTPAASRMIRTRRPRVGRAPGAEGSAPRFG